MDRVVADRILVVAALKQADESKRLMGRAYDAETGGMCVCAVAADALGISWDKKKDSHDQEWPYDEVAASLGLPDTQLLTGLNDALKFGWEEPMYTFEQIGERLDQDWDLGALRAAEDEEGDNLSVR